MYDHLRGELTELNLTRAVVDVGGVGYECRIPLSTFDQLKGKKKVLLLTHVYVREDVLGLFGFASSSEREFFRLVLSVSGVGPSIALAALSALSPDEAARAIAEEDIKVLQRIKGVGKKLAERLALELRERVGSIRPLATMSRPEATAVDAGGMFEDTPEGLDVVRALVGLGYDHKAARGRVAAAYRDLPKESPAPSPEQTAEVLLRTCLAMER